MAAKLNIQVSAEASAEHVVVTGSHAALGNWDPEKGVELEWRYNAWVTKEPISLPSANIQLKFVRLSERGHVEWESGENRVLELPAPSGKGQIMHLRSKFNGDCVLSPEVVPNKEALAAERAAVQAAADAALAVETAKRNHQLRIDQAREKFRRKLEDRAKIIAELQQGLEAARREVSELTQEEAQLVRDVQDAAACKLRALSRSFMEAGHTGEGNGRSTADVCDLSQVEAPPTATLTSSSIAALSSTEPKGPAYCQDLRELKDALRGALGPLNSSSPDDVSTTCSGLDTSSQASSKHSMESSRHRARQPEDECHTPPVRRSGRQQQQDTASPVKLPMRGASALHKGSTFSRGNHMAPLSSRSRVMKVQKPEPPSHEVFLEDWQLELPSQASKEPSQKRGVEGKEAVSLPAGALPEKQLHGRAMRTLSRCSEAPAAGTAPRPLVFDMARTPEELTSEEVPGTSSPGGKIGLATSQGLRSALQAATETYERVHGDSSASIEASYWGQECRKWANAVTVGRTDQSCRAWTQP